MTIFHTPRTAYEVSRWDFHGSWAQAILLGNLAVIGGICVCHVFARWYPNTQQFAESMAGKTTEQVEYAENVWKSITPHSTAVILPGLAVAGLLTRNGRKHGKRMVKEVFYGNLFKFTGVYGGDRVGG